MVKRTNIIILSLVLAVWMAAPAFAGGKKDGGGGNAASSKAVFSMNDTGVMFTKFDATEYCGDTGFDLPNDKLCTPWEVLFDLPDAIKTSNQGAIEAALSMECSLWTDTEATAFIGTSQSSGSRAGVEVRVTIDGYEMTPGQVVYCDRLQYIKLTIPDLFVTVDLGSSAGTFPIFSNDPFVLGLFQRTKNAHSYHYYMGTPATDLHHVQVYVRGIIQCFKDGLNAECQDAGIDIPKLVDGDGAANPIAGGTMAAVGKATLVVQEQQNWREMEPTP